MESTSSEKSHSSLKKNVGKLGVLLSIETKKSINEIQDLGKQLAMQIAASSPLAIDKENLDQKVLNKEKEIITEELKNSGKDTKIIEKIASSENPVGMDAVYVHALILDKLQAIEKRLSVLESRIPDLLSGENFLND